MTEIISIKTNNFKIYDENSNFNVNNPHYLLGITVKELKYENNNYYYDIGYNYKFIKSDLKSDHDNQMAKVYLHPFYGHPQYLDSSSGDIVFKNDMITKMIEYLLMDDVNLIQYTGSTTVQRYRINIMFSIALFWD